MPTKCVGFYGHLGGMHLVVKLEPGDCFFLSPVDNVVTMPDRIASEALRTIFF